MASRLNCTLRCLLPLIFALCVFLSIPAQVPASAEAQESNLAKLNFSNVILHLRTAHPIEIGSLTAILPVTWTSLPTLRSTLSPLLGSLDCVSQVLIVCPESLLLKSRAAIRELVRTAPESLDHPDVSFHSWGGEGDPTAVVLQAAARASTKWLLLLDDTGFNGLSKRTREMLLCPMAADLPIGPRGVVGNQSCAPPSPETRPASYLLPPFTIPSALAQGSHRDWSDFGRAISQSRRDRLGGVVRGYGDPDASWCNSVCHPDTSVPANQRETFPLRKSPDNPLATTRSPPGLFIFLLPNIEDLYVVLQLLCRLDDAGHSLKILLYSGSRPASGVREPSSRCSLQYDTLSSGRTERHLIYDWVERMDREANIIFTVNDAATQPVTSERATLVRIPREDLMHAHWMGSLTLTEWMSMAPFYYSGSASLI